MEEKLCPECGNPIYGRSDKKYCSDACRNSYNNRLNSDTTNFVRNVNNTLRRNRRVLEELNPEGKTMVERRQLLGQGFDFEFYTSTYETKTGDRYHFCYDQGYLQIDDQKVLLVKKKEGS